MKSLGIFASGAVLGLVLGLGLTQLLKKEESRVQEASPSSGTESKSNPDCPPAPPCPDGCVLLPAPEFKDDLPDPIPSGRDGDIRVAWKAVPGAIAYRIYLEDNRGKQLKSWRSKGTTAYLSNFWLPPSDQEMTYSVRVATQNRYGIEGEKGASRNVLMKAQVQLPAPKVKEIRIED